MLDGRRRRDPIGVRGAVMALLTVIAAVVLSSVHTVTADRLLSQSPGSEPRFEVTAIKRSTSGDEMTFASPAAGVALTAQASFEVASIRRTDSLNASGSTFVRPGGAFLATNISALNLIVMAYRIPASRVLNAPGWATDERYVIEARAPGISTLGEAVPLVMSLLNDRFKLVARKETRELPVYLLRVARSDGTLGPRMRKADPDCLKDELPAKATAAAPPGGMPCRTMLETGRVTGGAVNVGILLGTLTSASGRPVLNRTDLGDFYNIDLEWAPTPDADGVSIFTAVEEQLGLRLESGTAPLDVVVVERIERPTDN